MVCYTSNGKAMIVHLIADKKYSYTKWVIFPNHVPVEKQIKSRITFA